MKVEILSSSGVFQLQRDINDELERISQKGDVVLDLKFTDVEDDRASKKISVMIIYCDKAEMRDIKLNNILGE